MINYHNVRDRFGRFKKATKPTKSGKKTVVKNYRRGPIHIDPKYIYQILLLDESGSMGGSKAKALIEGYNANIMSMIDLQKKIAKENTHILCTTYSFSGFNHTPRIQSLNSTPNDTILLSKYNYSPSGGTPLVSAICKAIDNMKRHLGTPLNWYVGKEKDVIITVYTDGEENNSSVEDKIRIRGLINEMEQVYGWTFAFMGAGTKEMVQASADIIGMGTNVYNFSNDATGITSSSFTYTNATRSKAINYANTGTTSNVGFFSQD